MIMRSLMLVLFVLYAPFAIAADRLCPDIEELRKASPDTMTGCLLYTSPSPRDRTRSRMPSSA